VCVFPIVYMTLSTIIRAVSCECVNVCATAAAAVGCAAAAAAAVILHQNEFDVTMPHSQKTDLLFQTVVHCALCCVNQP
jgi:predicted lysophospholipase L1 biosynthesis ABC-type transport system permease subunit